MRPSKAKQRKTDNYKAPDERKQLCVCVCVGNPKNERLAVNIRNLYKNPELSKSLMGRGNG
jgi:hypothetical protein